MKKLISNKSLFFILLISIQLITYAQKKEYKTAKIIEKAPQIDGLLNDPAWNTTEWSGNFVQTSPNEKAAPSQSTQFKVIYDDNNLYFAIRAFDSAPDSIAKRMSRRDGFDGDFVEVNIDSYHDLLTGFSFTVNASGVKGDERITNSNQWDSSWDPIWYVKTSIDDLGWVAEMRIPLTQLRFGKQDNYVWGLQVNRHLFRKQERSSWQFISPQASGWVNHFGELHGIKDIVPKKQKDITPYVVGKIENYEKDEDNPFADGRDLDGAIGVDGKFGITNDLTLDFTINPDFGQVEADPSEVNLSTFETFFPEKRTFFIEGKDILSHQITPGGPMRHDNLFYSRRIGRHPGYRPDTEDDEYVKMPQNTTILGAFKLTGKTKKGTSIGIMESFTEHEKAEIAKEIPNGTEKHYEYRKEAAEPFTNYFAARIEQDLNNSNTRVGAMITATNRNLNTPELKDNMHSAAYTGGINFKHEWKEKTYYVELNAVASQVQGNSKVIQETQTKAPHFLQRPDGNHLKLDSTKTNLSGNGGTFTLGKAGGGKWRFQNWITYRSPGLNLNDMGYMQRADEIQQVFWIGFRETKPKSFYRSYSINFNEWVGTSTGPEFKYWGTNVNAHMQLKNYWYIGANFSRESKSISTDALRGGPSLIFDPSIDYSAYVSTDDRKKIQLWAEGFGGGRDGKSGGYQGILSGVNFQLSNALKLSIEPRYKKSNDEIEFVNNIDSTNYQRYIRGTINRVETSLIVRISYNITPDFTIQYYGMPFISAGDYNEYKYITDSRAEDFSNRYSQYSIGQISYNPDDDEFNIDEDINGTTDYSFENPNFNVSDFNSNLVLRWEYLPGSTVYLVWTQQRKKTDTEGKYAFREDASNLFLNTFPRDVFLVKFSYRFGV